MAARFWERPLPLWRTALLILFFALAAVLSWTARRTLGRQWRLAPWPLLLIATAVFILGTEIRVRAEDRLLASRFGERFQNYRRSAGAYIPFVKR